MATIPDHAHVPACDTHRCVVCSTCGRVHHGGGSTCISCWVNARSSGVFAALDETERVT